jgi:carboxymethylenebutenolidase
MSSADVSPLDFTSVQLTARDGQSLPALVYRPVGPGRYPAIVLGVEAYGINDFGHRVGARLASAGYVVVIPDYYRGKKLNDPEDYLDFTEVMEFIAELDFTAGAHDQLTAIDYAAHLDFVDADRIAVWGYCTGATLALLAAEFSDRVAAAVLFFPSQPRFAELTPKTPVHPVDLLWALRCPTLIIYGDQDAVMSTEDLADLEARLTMWGIAHQINIYPDAGHAFAAPVPPMRNDAADVASWAHATMFLGQHLSGSNG